MDFQDVSNWEANKLDRTQNSRMGWSDVSMCLAGPVVEDLKMHFAQRWNFIYKEKLVTMFSNNLIFMFMISSDTMYVEIPVTLDYQNRLLGIVAIITSMAPDTE